MEFQEISFIIFFKLYIIAVSSFQAVFSTGQFLIWVNIYSDTGVLL